MQPSSRRRVEEVDEITRAILYPWVREALEQLAIMRDECMMDIYNGKCDALRALKLTQHVSRIDRILGQAFPVRSRTGVVV